MIPVPLARRVNNLALRLNIRRVYAGYRAIASIGLDLIVLWRLWL